MKSWLRNISGKPLAEKAESPATNASTERKGPTLVSAPVSTHVWNEFEAPPNPAATKAANVDVQRGYAAELDALKGTESVSRVTLVSQARVPMSIEQVLQNATGSIVDATVLDRVDILITSDHYFRLVLEAWEQLRAIHFKASQYFSVSEWLHIHALLLYGRIQSIQGSVDTSSVTPGNEIRLKDETRVFSPIAHALNVIGVVDDYELGVRYVPAAVFPSEPYSVMYSSREMQHILNGTLYDWQRSWKRVQEARKERETRNSRFLLTRSSSELISAIRETTESISRMQRGQSGQAARRSRLIVGNGSEPITEEESGKESENEPKKAETDDTKDEDASQDVESGTAPDSISALEDRERELFRLFEEARNAKDYTIRPPYDRVYDYAVERGLIQQEGELDSPRTESSPTTLQTSQGTSPTSIDSDEQDIAKRRFSRLSFTGFDREPSTDWRRELTNITLLTPENNHRRTENAPDPASDKMKSPQKVHFERTFVIPRPMTAQGTQGNGGVNYSEPSTGSPREKRESLRSPGFAISSDNPTSLLPASLKHHTPAADAKISAIENGATRQAYEGGPVTEGPSVSDNLDCSVHNDAQLWEKYENFVDALESSQLARFEQMKRSVKGSYAWLIQVNVPRSNGSGRNGYDGNNGGVAEMRLRPGRKAVGAGTLQLRLKLPRESVPKADMAMALILQTSHVTPQVSITWHIEARTDQDMRQMLADYIETGILDRRLL